MGVVIAARGRRRRGADRRATSDERKAVARAVDLPTKCAKVRISTATAEPKWASAIWTPGPKKCEPYASNGVAC